MLPVWAVDSAQEALEKTNDSPYGLTTSIWTTNYSTAESRAAHAKSGVVTINNSACTAAMPFAPWSGRKDSGTGVTSSPLAILEMVAPKFILIDRNADPEVWWFRLSEQATSLRSRRCRG